MLTAEREQARTYYVEHLLSINIIEDLLPEVSRKSFYNWKKEDNWDLQRAEHIKNHRSNRQLLDMVYKAAAGAALHDPDEPMKLFGVRKVVEAMETWDQAKLDKFNLTPEEKDQIKSGKKNFSESTYDKMKEMMGLK